MRNADHTPELHTETLARRQFPHNVSIRTERPRTHSLDPITSSRWPVRRAVRYLTVRQLLAALRASRDNVSTSLPELDQHGHDHAWTVHCAIFHELYQREITAYAHGDQLRAEAIRNAVQRR